MTAGYSCVIIPASVPVRNGVVDHRQGVLFFIGLQYGAGQSSGNLPVEFDAAITDITADVDHTYKGTRFFFNNLYIGVYLLLTTQCRVTVSFNKNDFHKEIKTISIS